MSITLTKRELDVMSVVWDLGAATVGEVRGRLADHLAYSTVLTIFRTLKTKGYVRYEQEGRAFRYYPLIQPDDVDVHDRVGPSQVPTGVEAEVRSLAELEVDLGHELDLPADVGVVQFEARSSGVVLVVDVAHDDAGAVSFPPYASGGR